MESNIEITTERMHKVVLKPYVTGAEKQSIGDAYIDAKVEPGIKPSESLKRSTKRAIEVCVISVDGKTTNIYDEVMALPHHDTAEVVEKINEITESKKKVSST